MRGIEHDNIEHNWVYYLCSEFDDAVLARWARFPYLLSCQSEQQPARIDDDEY